MAKISVAERVAVEVAALNDMPREDLVERWERQFGSGPPRGCGRGLLELAATYALQEKAFGGLSAAIRRKLGDLVVVGAAGQPVADNAANGAAGGVAASGTAGESGGRFRRSPKSSTRALSIKPGTRLVREWKGRTHHVEVMTDGFRWNGQKFRTLSMVARQITGTHWSGPRFFGL